MNIVKPMKCATDRMVMRAQPVMAPGMYHTMLTDPQEALVWNGIREPTPEQRRQVVADYMVAAVALDKIAGDDGITPSQLVRQELVTLFGRRADKPSKFLTGWLDAEVICGNTVEGTEQDAYHAARQEYIDDISNIAEAA